MYEYEFKGDINGRIMIPTPVGEVDLKKIKSFVSVKDFGAVGDGVTDDTKAIQKALSDPTVRSLYIPNGTYKISGNGDQLLLLTRSIKLFGDGGSRSFLMVDASTPSTTDVLRVKPAVNTLQRLEIQGIGIIHNGDVNNPPARHGIHMDITEAGSMIKNSLIFRCLIYRFGGKSIKLTNPINRDGFFTSGIIENFISGGIDLERSGDSISIIRNTIPGYNVGIHMTTVSGAFRTFISENNITARGGAIVLSNCSQVTIFNNQIEHIEASLPTDSACVTIDGGNNIIIEENNIDNNGFLDHCIKLNNTLSVSIDKNSFNTSNNQIKVESNSKHTFIGYKNVSRRNGNLRENLIINNTGVGTTNVDVPVTLLNSWVNSDTVNYGVARCHKTTDGTCHLKGLITGGTVTVGTQLFVLPEGFRPQQNMHAVCYSHNGSAVVLGSVRILVTGEVSIRGGANNLFGLDGISFKADNHLA